MLADRQRAVATEETVGFAKQRVSPLDFAEDRDHNDRVEGMVGEW